MRITDSDRDLVGILSKFGIRVEKSRNRLNGNAIGFYSMNVFDQQFLLDSFCRSVHILGIPYRHCFRKRRIGTRIICSGNKVFCKRKISHRYLCRFAVIKYSRCRQINIHQTRVRVGVNRLRRREGNVRQLFDAVILHRHGQTDRRVRAVRNGERPRLGKTSRINGNIAFQLETACPVHVIGKRIADRIPRIVDQCDRHAICQIGKRHPRINVLSCLQFGLDRNRLTPCRTDFIHILRHNAEHHTKKRKQRRRKCKQCGQ